MTIRIMERLGLGRYAVLLTGLLLLLILHPLLGAGSSGNSVWRVLMTWILLACLHAVSERKWVFRAGAVLLLPSLIDSWDFLSLDTWGGLAATFFPPIFFLYLSMVIFIDLVRARRITMDILVGSACVYLLMGLTYALFYALIERFLPGSISISDTARAHLDAELHAGYVSELLYFSFSTQTTVGYGDITPVRPLARSLAMIQAVEGQFYIAIMVGRLVGLNLGQSIAEANQAAPSRATDGAMGATGGAVPAGGGRGP